MSGNFKSNAGGIGPDGKEVKPTNGGTSPTKEVASPTNGGSSPTNRESIPTNDGGSSPNDGGAGGEGDGRDYAYNGEESYDYSNDHNSYDYDE